MVPDIAVHCHDCGSRVVTVQATSFVAGDNQRYPLCPTCLRALSRYTRWYTFEHDGLREYRPISNSVTVLHNDLREAIIEAVAKQEWEIKMKYLFGEGWVKL